jgi:hypothetical protein
MTYMKAKCALDEIVQAIRLRGGPLNYKDQHIVAAEWMNRFPSLVGLSEDTLYKELQLRTAEFLVARENK